MPFTIHIITDAQALYITHLIKIEIRREVLEVRIELECWCAQSAVCICLEVNRRYIDAVNPKIIHKTRKRQCWMKTTALSHLCFVVHILIWVPEKLQGYTATLQLASLTPCCTLHW